MKGKKKVQVAPVGKNIVARLFNGITRQGLESFGRYYGTYRAIVHNNEDPENCDRLQVIIPQLTGDIPYEEWIYPKNNFAGQGYGVHCLPQNGDLVWVSFELGDIDGGAIWEHGHWGKGEKPEDGDLLDGTGSFWFVSPAGHKVIINDTKDTIYIKHKSGDLVKLTDGKISLKASSKISLGKEDESDEPGVLGNKNEEALKDLANAILDIIQAFTTADVATDYSGAAFKANLIASTATAQANMQTFLASTAKNTKSTKVTLD